MGAFGGPDIVTDGLVLALDAGSERSYPGTGTSPIEQKPKDHMLSSILELYK